MSTEIKDFWNALTVDTETAYELLLLSVEAGTTAMMWGQHGVGKTSIVHQLSRTLMDERIPEHSRFSGYITINPSQTDIIDFKLPYIKTEDTGEVLSCFAYSGILPRKGKWVIFVDEINTAPQSLQPALYSLILEGRIGDYRLPEGCVRLAAGNREEDQCAAQPMSAALKDRLNLHMFVVPTAPCWGRWAAKNGVRADLQAWVQSDPITSLRGHNPQDPTAGSSPRSIEALSKKLNVLDAKPFSAERKASLRESLLYGTIGQGAASQLMGFLDMYHNQISLDEILKNPTGYKIPTGKDSISLTYCITYGLAERMNRDNIKDIFTFLGRIEPTYVRVALDLAIARKDSGISWNTPAVKELFKGELVHTMV